MFFSSFCISFVYVLVYLSFFVRLHQKTATEAYGDPDTSVHAMSMNAEARLAALKAEHGVLGCMEMIGPEMVAGLVSPVMLRAHTLL